MSIETKLADMGENIAFVKYQFTDLQGNMREVTLSKDNVKGDCSTTVDGSSAFGKIIPPTESNMLLVPDPNTLTKIPWTDDTTRVICNVFYPPKEGEEPRPFEGCPRSALAAAEKKMEALLKSVLSIQGITKFHAHFAPELEFILLDEGYPLDRIHLDQGLQNDSYFVPLRAKRDAVLKQMTRYLGEMGLKREKYHSEVTTHQCEIGMSHGNALRMADATMTLKYIIQNVAELNGMRASFIPKFRKGVNGSGMHVHQNLAITTGDKEQNIFYDPAKADGLSDIGRFYIAGLLMHAKGITALTNPTPVSYKRLVPGCEAPTYIAWDWQNRTALCRGHSESTKKVRVEYRAPDPQCNPYLAFAAMLSAGLDGIKNMHPLREPDKRNYYHDNTGVEELPANLGEALENLRQSAMCREWLGDFIVDTVHKLGRDTWRAYTQEVSDVDIRNYL
jgi:glutamine synthetase